MLKHNLLIAFRSFKRNKSSFIINIIGLSTGIACTILIYLWVTDELRFDKFHKNDDQLFQVMQNLHRNANDVLTWEWTPGILAKALKEEMPEIEKAIQTAGLGNNGVIGQENNRFKAKELFVEPDFFNMFSFQLSKGNKQEVLNDKKSILLSEEVALKLFNTTENILGRTVNWERNWENVSGEYIVSGIFENVPSNSSLQFDVLFSYALFLENKPDALEWYNSDPFTYITLKQGTELNRFNDKIKDFLKTKHESAESTLLARKYSDQYLYANFENGVQSGGRISYVKLFSLIALFILIIACINFINLTTAKSSKRFKEVGVKKAIGANRRSLIWQYLAESSILVAVALFIALLFVSFSLNSFNEITGKEISLNLDRNLILASLTIAFITSIIAGSYPAFYLSGFKPANILKGTIHKSFGELWARKGLVVFQFSLSILLIVAVAVIFKQLNYVQSKNLGYSKDNVLVFQKDGAIRDSTETFLSELRKISGILNTSTLDGNLTGSHGYTTSIRWEGYENPENPVRVGVMIVGNDMVNTLDMELTQGRDFRKDIALEEGKTIINETAAKTFGFDNPIGKVIRHRRNEFEIIGVVKDFHFESMYAEVKPCMLRPGTYGNNIYAKISQGREQETLAKIEKLYSKFNPGVPFDFKFIDDDYQKLYTAEYRVAKLSKYFAGFAILISCLGLFGLAAFTAERRAKEISIRKILGSSIFGIIQLLSKELTKMVFISILISLPVSYLFAKRWLDSFAFHTDLTISTFIFAGLMALLIAIATLSWQAIKAAYSNPATALTDQ